MAALFYIEGRKVIALGSEVSYAIWIKPNVKYLALLEPFLLPAYIFYFLLQIYTGRCTVQNLLTEFHHPIRPS